MNQHDSPIRIGLEDIDRSEEYMRYSKLVKSHALGMIQKKMQETTHRYDNTKHAAIEDPFVLTRFLGHPELQVPINFYQEEASALQTGFLGDGGASA